LGFEWDSTGKIYSNYDVYQIVAIQKVDASPYFAYHVFYINAKGEGKHESVDQNHMFSLIGEHGTLNKSKKEWVATDPSDKNPATKPSGETYKKHDNESNAHLIKLNDHDTKLLEKSGFIYVPHE